MRSEVFRLTIDRVQRLLETEKDDRERAFLQSMIRELEAASCRKLRRGQSSDVSDRQVSEVESGATSATKTKRLGT
jgi:hypothetical protein